MTETPGNKVLLKKMHPCGVRGAPSQASPGNLLMAVGAGFDQQLAVGVEAEIESEEDQTRQ